MDYKQQLEQSSQEALTIAEKNEVSNEITNDLKTLEDEISDFKVKVPLMGGFNAGKSSLLNNYLGNDKLPTDIKPETAFAAELKYSSDEKVIAHHKNGGQEEFSIEELQEISGDYLYLEIFQDNPKLKELTDVILVDMPGLDSSLELHNQAIMHYVEEGVFYIVVADVDHGLKGTVISFLRELNLYKLNFAVLLNKTDRKPDSQVKEVVSNTQNIVSKLAGEDVFVGSTSAHEGEVADFKQIINSLNKDQLMADQFKGELIDAIDDTIQQLKMRINFQRADTDEIDDKIAEIKARIAEVEQRITKEKSKIKDQFNHQTPNQILNDVRMSLQNNMNRLVQAAKAGESQFSTTVNQVIRPTLTSSTKENIEVVLRESFDNIGSDLQDIFEMLKQQSPQKTDSEIPNMLAKADFNFDNKKLNGIFKTIVGGLGITTSIVAPWLEVIVMFLPEIFNLLGIGSGKQEEKLRNKIKSKIIPDIIEQLRPKIQSSLTATNDQFIEQVNKEVEKEKQQLVDALNKAKQEKKEQEKEFAAQQQEFEADIKKLEQIKATI